MTDFPTVTELMREHAYLRSLRDRWSVGFERLRRLHLPGGDEPDANLPAMAADEIERLRAEVDRLTGEKEELRALISSCDSGQTALTCHLKLRLIRDAMRAVCTQRRDCMAIDHDYPCPMGGRP